MGKLDGKVAVVTGAARGIGLDTAELLAEDGARVVLADLDAAALESAHTQIAGETFPFAGDLTEAETPNRLIQRTIDEWGQLDIVVNNAGYTWDGPLHKMSDRQFQAMLDIHTVVPFRILRAAAPYMREPAKLEVAEGIENFRKVVNVSSTSGTLGNAGQANYASAKAAITGLTKTLAKEWGSLKINVNAVAFGFVDTRLTATDGESFESGSDEIQLGMSEKMRGLATMMTPLGRPATTAEAAAATHFLCSPASNYVHGQVLTVSGGLLGGMS